MLNTLFNTFKILLLMCFTFNAFADDEVLYSSLPYRSVAENIAAMDTDHDGMVTVHEVRVYMESQHGKGFQQKVFDDMERSAENRSCGSSFSKSLY